MIEIVSDTPGDQPDKGLKAGPVRTFIFHPYVKGALRADASDESRPPSAKLDELCGLAEAIDVSIVEARLIGLSKPRPATLLGQGKVDEIAEDIKAQKIELVVVDGNLSPIQQRNLERAWRVKVIDRTGLILEIFGERAATREGELQVELAHLEYQKSRLVRSWTHLERQRGGFGFLGGPGETQIEADRRIITERITQIRKQLEKVKRTRGLHRTRRQKAPYPVVALVGYTNAGKSTLFNHLTRAHVLAEDMLFATLDPTMRAIDLSTGRKVILSDTVGFISDLPTHLVAAFRATLEEVTSADLIVHVRDASHPDSEAQKADVLSVLADLGLDASAADAPPMIEAMNKLDLMTAEERQVLDNRAQRNPDLIPISAITGEGLSALSARIDTLLGAKDRICHFDFDVGDGKRLAWLHRHGDVIDMSVDDKGTAHISVCLTPIDHGKFLKMLD